MSRNLLIAALALGSATASAQVVNTQVNGLTLTNGLSSITDSSALPLNANVGTGIGYLTDSDISTFAFNIGNVGSGFLQGNFSSVNSSSTGIYIVSLAGGIPLKTFNGPSFSVQLALQGGLSSATTYGDSDFVITSQKISTLSYWQGVVGIEEGTVETGINPEVTFFSETYYAYLYVPFSDFSVSPSQVLGIRFSNFTQAYPDISFIGAGYAGAPVPEPSTYGLILGGLALAGAAIRRRKSAK